mgnify:CR=1 FL=1
MSSIGTLKVKKSVLAARRMRFQDNLVVDTKGSSPKSGFLTSPSRIKGKCQDVDKGYLRLTEAADPALIRPLPVLKQALDKVKAKYLEEEDYVYACDQLKSIRQDLTVQGIKGRFTAHVYETHGRIALEQGDLNEYQACQVRLQEMAKVVIGGRRELVRLQNTDVELTQPEANENKTVSINRVRRSARRIKEGRDGSRSA